MQGKRERQREKGCRRRSLSTFRIRILRVSFFSGGRVAVIPNPFPFLELYSDPYFSRCFSAPLPCQTPCFILFFFLLMFRPGFLYLVSWFFEEKSLGFLFTASVVGSLFLYFILNMCLIFLSCRIADLVSLLNFIFRVSCQVQINEGLVVNSFVNHYGLISFWCLWIARLRCILVIVGEY